MDISLDLTKRLESIAQREGRSVDALLQNLLDDYEVHQQNALENFIGAFDDDITNLSETVHNRNKNH